MIDDSFDLLMLGDLTHLGGTWGINEVGGIRSCTDS